MFGSSLVFDPVSGPLKPFIGGLQWAGLLNWDQPWGEGQLNLGAVVLFKFTFAIITPALLLVAVIKRINFGAWMASLVAWSTFVYLP
jgi:Amt family ammonium transporter